MRKFNSFFGYFILLSIFIIIISAVFHVKIEKMDGIWILYYTSLDLLNYIPVITGLCILWPLVFRSKSDIQNPVSNTTLGFFVIMFIFIIMGGVFAFQELAVPKLYEFISHQAMLKEKNLNMKVKFTDVTGVKFSMAEFNNLKYLPVKNDIAFSMGKSYAYFQKMYNGSGSYYIEGFRLIAYNSKNQLDYIVAAEYGKISEGDLYAVNPVYYEYRGGIFSKTQKITGIKKIPIVYDANGIYALSSESTAKIAGLIDIFMYNDYVYDSKINFFHLGNIVFNKIAYYISLIFVLIICASFGAAFQNLRPLYREYFQTACFYVLSALSVALLYDTLVAVVNMIYGMSI